MLNADFSQRAVVHAQSLDWQPSPMAGVERRPLERVGAEVARATSIVRYAPGSAFSAHVHHGGEEYLVLDGVFQDEHGSYPAGTYVRNPPSSQHTPRSDDGCTIFVKLWQFDPQDRTQLCVDTLQSEWAAKQEQASVSQLSLYQDQHEQVSLQHWGAHTTVTLEAPRGLEVLVLQGGFSENGEHFVQHSWLRLPVNSRLRAQTTAQGATVWLKQDHLADVDIQLSRLPG